MAKPRVFISSTFYDLRQIREDLERFIKEIGFESIRNETGTIPYGSEKAPEEYAYREIDLCDIVVSIIGGRFGSESAADQQYSISQKELQRALDKGIQVYIFIEKNVNAEFQTYQLNKRNSRIKYRHVDNPQIYEFIEQVHKLPKNNPIASFEVSLDIVDYLRNQWAGLFQGLLQERKRLAEAQILSDMKAVSGTLKQLVTYLTEERKNKDGAIQQILISNHPAFQRFRELTNTPYRVFFSSLDDLNAWLKARGWKEVSGDELDVDSKIEWIHEDRDDYLKLTENIFDEHGNLKIYTQSSWKDEWLFLQARSPKKVEDDDIPF
ncbi:MAG: DUF4062 domain-containing protein [Candidatus Tectomicrobia bacterium]|uniref:DUF4062 domain-containing protein n=1 Tax=Tectimicrobiota bacterium TaxID=2528274 RepID=A0A932I4X4_UNCTE|nr:DUF4062 domain-containing protein [Candidatus Tectomicrobia bacterium]